MNITLNINNWFDIFKVLDEDLFNMTNGFEKCLKHHIKIYVMIAALWTLYTVDKAVSDKYQEGTLTDSIINAVPLSAKKTFEFQLQKIIITMPTINNTLQNKQLDERERILATRDEFDFKCLNDEQFTLFQQTWCKTSLLKIENKELKFPPPKKPG